MTESEQEIHTVVSWCRRDRVLTGALVALLLAYALVPLDPAVLQVWYVGLATLAVLVGFQGVRVRRPAHPRGWLLTLSGFSGWVVGDVMWFAETPGGGERFPAPSDAVQLLSYGVLGAGVLTMVRTRRSGGDRAASPSRPAARR